MTYRNSEDFTGLYPISKTLKNELRPVGKTLENIQKNGILEDDFAKTESYQNVKKKLDDYHRDYIECILQGVHFEDEKLREIIDAVKEFRKSSDDKSRKNLNNAQTAMRKEIVEHFKKDSTYTKLFGEKMLTEILPEYVAASDDISKDEKSDLLMDISRFKKFTTYFTKYNENRKNIYSAEEKNGTISYRVVNQNLMRFIDNMNSYEWLKKSEISTLISDIKVECSKFLASWREETFTNAGFNFVLTQKGIDDYNKIVGAVNKCVNLYCQQCGESKERVKAIRKNVRMKPLYKQILSISDSSFYIPEKIASNDEVKDIVIDYSKMVEDKNIAKRICDLFKVAYEMDLSKIYIKTSEASKISLVVYEKWNVIDDSIKLFISRKNANKKKRVKKTEGESFYSIAELQDMLDEYFKENETVSDVKLTDYFEHIKNAAENIKSIHTDLQEHCSDFENFRKDSEITIFVKEKLDKYLDIVHALKVFEISDELDKSLEFYPEFEDIFMTLNPIVKIYDKVRNYATMKPYSNEKCKLNFKNPTLAAGWDKNKESDYSSIIMIKDDKYFVGIMNVDDKPKFVTTNHKDGSYKKMVYKLLPGPHKMLPKVFFSKKGIDSFNPPEEILDGYKNKKFIKGGENFDRQFLGKLIDWYKEALSRHEDWKKFNFKFSDTESYNDISDFYNEVAQQGYKITYEYIVEADVDNMVNEGKLYLFQIYNKDFSEYKTGKDNLHTMYLKMLFDEDNLKDAVFKLNGNAELFYRKHSIKKENTFVHKKGSVLINKWTNEERRRPVPDDVYKELDRYYNQGFKDISAEAKKYLPLVNTRIAPYDIIKDKRYIYDKFMLHLPITINFKSTGRININELVCKYLKENKDINYIGIDRGERNLLYVTLIDKDGNIIKQKNFNVVANYDYKAKLEQKEKERDDARKSWTSIGKIKELKEGYLSQAIDEIVKMMLENNAVIIMEDLNFGFKRGRFKVERQVYQKFENMLIKKLNYVVRKDEEISSPGGLLKGLQLSYPVESVSEIGRQCGFIFYIPAAYTSKIDPVTGFVNVFDFKKITEVEKMRELFKSFESIWYNPEVCVGKVKTDVFEFKFKYEKFKHYQTLGEEGEKKEWTVSSFGDRIVWNRETKSDETIKLTKEIKSILEPSISYKEGKDIRKSIVELGDDKIKKLFYIFKIIVQLRNSRSGSDEDYILSPVKYEDMNGEEKYYYSHDYESEDGTGKLPESADANGAYNIALKGKYIIELMRKISDESGSFDKRELKLDNASWLEYMQTRNV